MSRDIGRLEALTMQLGKSLVGAIIGAALGIGLLLVVYLQFGIDKMWLAIPIALLTGLGVRMAATTSGHASYLRGALTVVLAMGAYFGGLKITQAVANHRATDAAKPKIPAAASEEPAEPGVAKEGEPGPEAPPPVVAPQAAPTHIDVAMNRPAMGQPSKWDIFSLAFAALVAYELGRGSGGVAKNTMGAPAGGPSPRGTHPDA